MNKESDIIERITTLDEQSDLAKEVLGRAPNWMIRWGITVIFFIVLLLIVGSSIFSYNDIIPAQIVITSKNPPIYLKTNATGRLTKVFVKPNQSVKKGEILAEIENSANIDDILILDGSLKYFEPRVISMDSLDILFSPYLELGSVQNVYGEFLTQYQEYILYNTLEPQEKEYLSIKRQLKERKDFLAQQKNQLELFSKDLALSKKAYDRNDELFQKGVISPSEFEQASRDYILDQQRYKGFLTNISETQIAIANFTNLLTQNKIQGTEFRNNYNQQLEKAYQNLKVALFQWQQQFLIKSPIDGSVTIFDIWGKYQNVNVGEVLFTVIPNDLEEIIGMVKLPIRNSGKAKKGQRVIIKLENYPFEEWGSLDGIVTNISEVPKQGKESFYTLQIKIESLATTFGKKIEFKQEMQGTAEIIVEELTILERIFYQLRKVVSR